MFVLMYTKNRISKVDSLPPNVPLTQPSQCKHNFYLSNTTNYMFRLIHILHQADCESKNKMITAAWDFEIISLLLFSRLFLTSTPHPGTPHTHTTHHTHTHTHTHQTHIHTHTTYTHTTTHNHTHTHTHSHENNT